MILVYMELASQPSFEYEKEIIQWAKKNLPHVSMIDLDNFSDAALFEQVIGSIEQEDKAMVIYDIKEDISSDKAISLTNAVLDHHEKTKVVFHGNHILLERLLNVMDENRLKNPTKEEEKSYIRQYLNKEVLL